MTTYVTGTVLTDDLFIMFGGNPSTSNDFQRQAAYAMAEHQATLEIKTFLRPTIVTGTYSWPYDSRLMLKHTHLNRVISVTAVHDAGCDCADDATELTGCAWVKHREAAIIDIRECGNTIQASCSGCSCGRGGVGPFQARVVYEAGLPTETLQEPNLLMGLVTAAGLALEQMVDPHKAEGGPGDPGVQSYSSLGYSESRTPLKMTAFGASARANYAARMLKPYKFKRALRLGK